LKRITISLPDELDLALEREARREKVSVSQMVREAIEVRLGRTKKGERQIPFAGISRSGNRTLSVDVDKVLAEEWTKERLIDRNR
jgi:metal-responsive CopG/Arc/MetJ family transcriptional regulator